MTKRTCTIPDCDNAYYARGLCNKHYLRARAHGTIDQHARTLSAPDATLDDRLRNIGWTEVIRRAELGPCWEWVGARNPAGYGNLATGARSKGGHCLPMTASRAAYTAWTEPIPEGRAVLHRCDNPPCINPAHLFLGTTQDNSTDMVDKGRSNYGTRSPVHRFTEDQIQQVRDMREAGATYEAIGEQMGMTRHHASLIVRGLRRSRAA